MRNSSKRIFCAFLVLCLWMSALPLDVPALEITEQLDNGAAVGYRDWNRNSSDNFVSFEMLAGDQYVTVDPSGYYGDADISELNTAVATLVLEGSETVTNAAQLGSDASFTGDKIDLADCAYTVTKAGNVWRFASTDAHGSPVYLYPGNTAGSGYPNRGSEYANLSVFAAYEDGAFCIMANDCDNSSQNTSYLCFNRASLRWERVASPGASETWLTNTSLYLYRRVSGDGSTEIPGYERITAMDQFTEGDYLVVAPGNDGNLYCLYPSTSTATRYSQIAKILGRTVEGYTRLTFTGVAEGYTQVRVGSTVYCVTVRDYHQMEVRIPVGMSATAEILPGDQTDMDMSGLDTGIAEVSLELLSDSKQVAWLGNDAAYTERCDDPAACLYTLIANANGTWLLSAVAEDGTTVYIDAHAGTGNEGYPNRTYATDVNLVNGVNGAIKIKDKGGTLHFWDTDTNKRHWDQCSGDTCSGHNLRWFRPAQEGELGDAIDGFVAVTDVADLVDGGQYLICGYADGTYYALHPSTSTTNKHAHVARIGTYTELSTQVIITGRYPGTTGFQLGLTQYTVVVTGEVVSVDLYNDQRKSYMVEGNWLDANLSAMDTTIATADLELITQGQVSTRVTFTGIAAGKTSVTLPGKVFEIKVTAHDHQWGEDRYCKLCGRGERYVKFTTYTTSLGGNIAMNFYVELSRDLVADPNAYMQFTFAGKTVKVPLGEGKKNGNVYQFSCPITSKNMSDDITAQVYNASGAVGESKTMAVDTYCNWIIDNFTDAKTINLMKSMLNYGASSQLLFKYRTDDLANAALTEEDKILSAVDASAYLHSRTGEEEGIQAKSYTLLLDSETTIRVYFQLTGDKTIDEYTFAVDGVEVKPRNKDGLWYIEKTNIAAHRLDDMHVFTCGDITIHYGGLSYVNQVMTYYTSGTTFDMAVALYNYSQAAEAYIA